MDFSLGFSPRRQMGGAVLALGALAGAGIGPVAAADLLSVKAPTAYMKACTAQGEGFFYIPGTDTCLRIGGYLWAEGYYNTFTSYPVGNNKTYTVANVGVIFDARTETEYGTLRSYIESRFIWRTGDPWSGALDYSLDFNPSSYPAEPDSAQVDLWNAYVQFAGFTAGKAQSFFDFYANANVLGTDPATIGDDTRLSLIAYTYEFSKGLSATVSAEDSGERVSGISTKYPFLPTALENYQAGNVVPDFVANLKYEGEWGSAQISGALHQVNAVSLLNPVSATQDTWGFAVQGGIMFNLPMLGEGDTLYLQTAYTDGASAYLGVVDPTGEYTPPDAFLGVFGPTKVSGWNFTASLLHNLNEKWSTAVFGGYAAYDFNDPSAQFTYGGTGGVNYNVGGYIAFAPVKSFTIALQYDYNFNEAKNYLPTAFAPTLASVDASQLMLFVSRTF